MPLRPLAALILISSLAGCELVASFDRDKIPPPSLMRPDASFVPPKPVEDLDSGSMDAATGDSAVADAGGLDGAVDGAVSPDAALDASLDGSVDGAVPDAATP